MTVVAAAVTEVCPDGNSVGGRVNQTCLSYRAVLRWSGTADRIFEETCQHGGEHCRLGDNQRILPK